jgi:hypothetical protein
MIKHKKEKTPGLIDVAIPEVRNVMPKETEKKIIIIIIIIIYQSWSWATC